MAKTVVWVKIKIREYLNNTWKVSEDYCAE